jgi:hypothetical protein
MSSERGFKPGDRVLLTPKDEPEPIATAGSVVDPMVVPDGWDRLTWQKTVLLANMILAADLNIETPGKELVWVALDEFPTFPVYALENELTLIVTSDVIDGS